MEGSTPSALAIVEGLSPRSLRALISAPSFRVSLFRRPWLGASVGEKSALSVPACIGGTDEGTPLSEALPVSDCFFELARLFGFVLDRAIDVSG